MKDISLKDLLETGGHFGHQTVRWNPKMKPYLFAAREGVHIFDLAKTKQGLEEAYAYVKAVASQGGKILFLGTKRQSREIVEKTAQKVGMPYVSERWLGGTITNFEQIKKSLTKLGQMKEKREAGEYKELTKKEQLLIDREILRLEKFFGGLGHLETPPEAIFIVDVKREFSAALEAKRRDIKVVAMVDSNADPDLVDYVIPINDDAVQAIEFVVGCLGEAIEEGIKQFKQPKQPESKSKVKPKAND